METPGDKSTSGYLGKLNLFTSSSKLMSNDLKFNYSINNSSKENVFLDSHNRNFFSFSKFMKSTSCKKPRTYESKSKQLIGSVANKKLKFTDCSVKYEKDEGENNKEIHKLDLKKSVFKISNVNFDINLNYLK
jgi:hypothetical protein